MKYYLVLALFFIFMFCACSNTPIIQIETEMGSIEIELYQDKAPITVANFLRYVDSLKFENGSFYRVVTMDNQPDNDVKIEVIQGGRKEKIKAFDAIKHETTDKTGILHEDGTLSMARGSVGSATSEFFICVGVQPELNFGGKRNLDGQGFAAFGKVINGMDIVRKIQQQPAEKQYLNPRIIIKNITRLKK